MLKHKICIFLVLICLFFSGCNEAASNLNNNITATDSSEPVKTQEIKYFSRQKAKLFVSNTEMLLKEIASKGADKDSLNKAKSLISALESYADDSSALYNYMDLLGDTLKVVVGYAEGTSYERDLGNKFEILFQAESILNDKEMTQVLNNKYLWFYAAAACNERGMRAGDEVVFTAVGDTCFGTYPEAKPHLNFDRIYEKNGGDLDYVFKNCMAWFKSDDYTVINFESAITDAEEHEIKPWPLKSKPEHAKILPASGIEAVNLANNHTKDYFEVGYEDTINTLENVKVDYFDDSIPLIKKIGDIEFVFLGYDCRVRLQNEAFLKRIKADVKKYKTPERYVIVNMHWGYEYRKKPADYQIRFGHEIIDAGADMIWGAHPHILEGVELYKGKYIIYSMGDFAFGGDPDLESRITCMFRFSFGMDNQQPVLKKLWVVPCYENSDGSLTENNYQPLPLFGSEADSVVNSLIDLGKMIKGGVTEFDYFNPF